MEIGSYKVAVNSLRNVMLNKSLQILTVPSTEEEAIKIFGSESLPFSNINDPTKPVWPFCFINYLIINIKFIKLINLFNFIKTLEQKKFKNR